MHSLTSSGLSTARCTIIGHENWLHFFPNFNNALCIPGLGNPVCSAIPGFVSRICTPRAGCRGYTVIGLVVIAPNRCMLISFEYSSTNPQHPDSAINGLFNVKPLLCPGASSI